MLKEVLDYISQPAQSSFRTVDSAPYLTVPSPVSNMEPLWKSVLLDFRDAPMALVGEITFFLQERTKRKAMEQIRTAELNRSQSIVTKLEKRTK